jgi:DNA-directed RNA polymerase, mitochondrial
MDRNMKEATRGSLRRRLLPVNVGSVPTCSIRCFRSDLGARRSIRTTPSILSKAFSAMSTVTVEGDDDDEVNRLSSSLQSNYLSDEIFDQPRSYVEWQRGESALVSDAKLEEIFEGVYEEDFQDGEAPKSQAKAYPSPRELLGGIDDDIRPPETGDLEETQLWLECKSQRDTVTKYQKVLASARSRKDYSSLSLVQKQVLEWYQPLKEEIEVAQKAYILRTENEEYPKSMSEGPNLCLLQPQKLAVISAQEAMVSCLMEPEGCRIIDICKRLGEGVETEVNVQLALYQRAANEKRRKSGQGDPDDDDEFHGVAHIDELEHEDPPLSEEKELDSPLFAVNEWSYGATHLKRFLQEGNYSNLPRSHKNSVRHAHKKARKLLNNKDPWTTKSKIQLGAVLLKILLKTTKVNTNGREEPAFFHDVVRDYLVKGKSQGIVRINAGFMKAALQDEFKSLSAFSTRHKPMVTPPSKWTGPQSGGYRWLKTNLMRTHGSKVQLEALHHSDLSIVYDGLNVLGQVPWKINVAILDVARTCWDKQIALGDIPTQTDVVVPPEPIKPDPLPRHMWQDRESEEYKNQKEQFQAYSALLEKHKRAKQKNMDLNSLRCSAWLKLDQADTFKSYEDIYFPYNLDFRGRAYPVPPHLSTVGSDLSRGLLTFSKKKPLGERGFYWLKVHLANLGGNDKISFDDRAKHTESNMDRIIAAVNDPFGEDRWWMELDDPFQGLAVCNEIFNAIESGDPETFMSSLPVHMDGSCNGLQHYAALGRDAFGGKAVNLVAAAKPQDVYSGVMHEVIRLVAEEAATDLEYANKALEDLTKDELRSLKKNRAAKLVNGLIDRGVVKRTVMTSVYGVTFIGARAQIREKIEEKLENKGVDIYELKSEIQDACSYLAKMTMDVMGQQFVGARHTMNWLTTCARLISKQGNPVAWISPIGVPVIQPYRQEAKHSLITLLQCITITNDADDLPLHSQRQATAFPPNYVHSLDSSHMLLTALEMDRRGLTFCAVHDSFWTHACDIDEMNKALRDSFIELYDQPLLETLKKNWEVRYPSITFPDLPERGTLDLNEVKESAYFFQ